MFIKEKYLGKTEEEIMELVKDLGFNPEKFTDEAGYVYEPHKHNETKLLVFIDGEMEVTINNKKFKCQKGDELIIAGNTVHSAVVGNNGCTFLWSEKII